MKTGYATSPMKWIRRTDLGSQRLPEANPRQVNRLSAIQTKGIHPRPTPDGYLGSAFPPYLESVPPIHKKQPEALSDPAGSTGISGWVRTVRRQVSLRRLRWSHRC